MLLEAQRGDDFTIEKDLNLGRIWISGEKSIELLRRIIIPPSDASVNELKNVSFFLNSVDTLHRLKNVWKNGNALSLTIRDLRLLSNDVKSSVASPDRPSSFQWPKESGASDIWSNERLKTGLSTFPSEKDIQQTKSSEKFLKWNQSLKTLQSSFRSTTISSSVLPAASKASSGSSDHFHLLLIRKSSEMKLFDKFEVDSSLSNCWSIILPYCYVSSTWNACMKLGATVLGLEEINDISRLRGELVFPNDYPDSVVGWNYWKDFYQKELEKANRKPKVKQVSVSSCYTSFSSMLDGAVTLDEENVVREVQIEGNESPSADFNQQYLRVVSNTGFLVVRNREYYSTVIPPFYSPPDHRRSRSNSQSSESSQFVNNSNNHNGILHCFNHSDWQFDESFPERSEFIALIPRTPRPTFIFVTLRPSSRGLPITGSLLFQPTVRDLRLFVHHRISRKMLLSSKQENKSNKKLNQKNSKNASSELFFDEEDGTEWKGIQLNSSDEDLEHDRKVMGIVTNGFYPHTNKGQSSVAIALVNINLLNDMISWYYGRFSYPLSHCLLLFQNPRSNWLRPAVYRF
jgi:hypothetical protein